MPAFDIHGDGRFQSSLQYLADARLATGVVNTLHAIQAANLPWAEFTEAYGWEEVVIQGSDDFAGRPDYRSFVFEAPDQTIIEIVGYIHQEAGVDTVVVCAVARKASLKA